MAKVLVFASYAESLVTFRGVLLQELVAGGHQVFACAPEAPDEIKDTLLNMGVTYQDIALERVGMNSLRDIFSVIELTKFFKRIKPDILLNYTIKPVIYGSLAARLADVPKIYSIITSLGYAFSKGNVKSRFVGFVARCLYRLGLSYPGAQL